MQQLPPILINRDSRPFIFAMIQGVQGIDLPDRELKPPQGCMTAPQSVTPQNTKLAERFSCSVRTIQRMRSAGIEQFTPEAVAAFLIEARNPPLPMLKATLEQLLDPQLEEL